MTPRELGAVVGRALARDECASQDDWLEVLTAAEVALEVLVTLADGRPVVRPSEPEPEDEELLYRALVAGDKARKLKGAKR